MGRPQTFAREADAVTYAAANGGTVEPNGKPKATSEKPTAGTTSADDIPPEIRAAVRRRSGGRCEIRSEGCSGAAWHMHHRLKRAHGVHTVENIVDTCGNCHTASPAALHRNIAWSIEVGLLLNSWENPPAEPWERPSG
jgi:hypothetical protein